MENVLTNDVVLENDEFFTLILTSSSESVSILTSSCTISIIDDDGGCPYHYQLIEKNVHMHSFLNRSDSKLGTPTVPSD